MLHEQIRQLEEAAGFSFQTIAENLSNVFLFLLIFGMSATVDTKTVLGQLTNKFAILTAVGMQFIIMPFLGYLAIVLLQAYGGEGLSQAMGLTLLIVTASPGGSYSNWWCSTFNADLGLSVAMTAISTILSIAMLPANLMLYAHVAYGFSSDQEEGILGSLDFSSLFVALGIVICAISLGLFASYSFPNPTFQIRANQMGSISGILLIASGFLLSAGPAEEEESEQISTTSPIANYIGVAFPCVVGLVLANVLASSAGLAKPEVVTIAVECCYQNVGIAMAAAVNMFPDKHQRAEALFVPLFYGLVEAVVIGLYCVIAWKINWTKAPASDPLWKVMAMTYEVSAKKTDEEVTSLNDGGKSGYSSIV